MISACFTNDCVMHHAVAVIENALIARDTYRVRLEDPAIARAILPGQFLMIRPGEGSDPLLGRPFALYDVARDSSGTPVAIDVVYQVVGRGTAALARRRTGDYLNIWGPLGNGFGPPPDPGGPVVFVAGGIGQTPFLALARDWLGLSSYGSDRSHQSKRIKMCDRATLLYGVRSADLLAGVADFEAAGVEVEIATDDGSKGYRGFTTDLLERRLAGGERPVRIVACGPPAMLAKAAQIASHYNVSCYVSLENHMACGFGVCFSCVAPIVQAGGSFDLRRVCVEGPVFDARSVAWDAVLGSH
jgi:dihydroorotate dehydrogenase electron transfer subunit